MCQSVCYVREKQIVITSFVETNARLPVLAKTGEIKCLTWGRRKDEAGILPVGGWISLEKFKQGQWDQYFPKQVKISVQKFMEADIEGQEKWFDVTPGQYLQGIYLQEQTERRIYIGTIIPEAENNVYPRWPCIVL